MILINERFNKTIAWAEDVISTLWILEKGKAFPVSVERTDYTPTRILFNLYHLRTIPTKTPIMVLCLRQVKGKTALTRLSIVDERLGKETWAVLVDRMELSGRAVHICQNLQDLDRRGLLRIADDKYKPKRIY